MRLPIMNKIKSIGPNLAERVLIGIDDIWRKGSPRAALRRLSSRSLLFFLRKKPQGDIYHFDIHYPAALKNCPDQLNSYYLVGRAWKVSPEAPIALAFGFNDWKLGFTADYCPDQRIAFSKRKVNSLILWFRMFFLKFRPATIYVWGYTNPKFLVKYAKIRRIPLIRVEDAFLRSAEIGAFHTTPYSLIFDKQGLFYNTDQPNDLENILSNYDFDGNQELLEQSRKAQKLVIKYGLSKYNLPDAVDKTEHFRIKTRHRVLVVGQVDKDAAVRMGNPNKWKQIDIVRLAKLENPNSDILYRPHPEVYKGFQKSKFRARQLAGFAEVLSPDGSIAELLETVDQVYTISSLTGLEALVRGIRVTTLGSPFYAGWGLTDDRTAARKKRKLSIDEIFAGCYLVYPRYLANLSDPYWGLKTACLRIRADKETLSHKVSAQFEDKNELQRLFSKNVDESESLNIDKLAMAVRYLDAEFVKKIYILCVLGAVEDDKIRAAFIEKCIELSSVDTINRIFEILFKETDNTVAYNTVLSKLIKKNNLSLPASSYIEWEAKYDPFYPENSEEEEHDGQLTKNNIGKAYDSIDEINSHILALIDDGEFDQAMSLMETSLVLFGPEARTLKQILEIAYFRFQFDETHELAKLLLKSGNAGVRSKAFTAELNTLTLKNSSYPLVSIANYLINNPEKVSNATTALERIYGDQYQAQDQDLILYTLKLGWDKSVRQVQGLLALDQTEEALALAEDVSRLNSNSVQAAVVLSRALSANKRTGDALKIIQDTVSAFPTELVFREYLRLCIEANEYELGKRILRSAEQLHISVGEMLTRKVLFGCREIHSALLTFRNLNIKQEMVRMYPNHYLTQHDNSRSDRSLFILAIFGPGDEIRWATIYSRLRSEIDCRSILIACDPRLLKLFERSFDDVEFTGVKRIRNSDAVDVSAYNEVRSSKLMGILDNSAHNKILESDEAVLISDILADFLTDYGDFSGKGYLVPNEKRSRDFAKKLDADLLKIGITWRSSVVSASRNEHYLTIEEISPIFEIEGIQLVNLQYDECSEELAYVRENYPEKLIDFKDLDQFNDFDGVASLISCLDLVVAPATTVVELAGALGMPTLLLSNSSELHWRKLENSKTDVWHNSVEHVEGEILVDKESLVSSLVSRLEQFVKNNGKL